MSEQYKTAYDFIESFKTQLNNQDDIKAKEKIIRAIKSVIEIQEALLKEEMVRVRG